MTTAAEASIPIVAGGGLDGVLVTFHDGCDEDTFQSTFNWLFEHKFNLVIVEEGGQRHDLAEVSWEGGGVKGWIWDNEADRPSDREAFIPMERIQGIHVW